MFLLETLMLDPDIRNWVVLPMVLIMVLMGLTRHYVQKLLQTSTSGRKIDDKDMKHKQTLLRAQRLRKYGAFLPEKSFEVRKFHFNGRENGLLRTKGMKGTGMMANNPMMNPMGMVDMMKRNMTFLIPNMIMMTWISYFFAGFVLVKMPFPLTNRFKLMLQRGINLGTLDVSYVSSLSWYFLVMFGLRGFYRLILGEDSDANNQAKMMQMQMGMGGGPMGFDAKKAFQQEKDSLELTQHTFIVPKAEEKLLESLKMKN